MTIGTVAGRLWVRTIGGVTPAGRGGAVVVDDKHDESAGIVSDLAAGASPVGLTSAQARVLLAEHGPNTVPEQHVTLIGSPTSIPTVATIRPTTRSVAGQRSNRGTSKHPVAELAVVRMLGSFVRCGWGELAKVLGVAE